ncbi:MAG: helix-turn-helix domain-containing protein [Moraxellaceae bacterium]|nr:helix-turn-helix domain-containing protein [Moraxellaceae bacterium]MBP7229102.1 helix-turn-helix domain-containing protein [Moraxellaceae bacterium]MBP8851402.1 helix-turn-helix domain-containing protein [Moraxellaceae bacterium]MBP9044961.1 helix-turn-helix domain-containing protein [Moraxellaceae bacterium]MBP9730104.1 helix-turn-helix domain-containing protein [Moraxellaceae bacterium]
MGEHENMSVEGQDSGEYTSFKPGQRLKKARELRGLNLDQVAAELRLSRRILDGMESDDYSTLPEPAFVRGYMRRYAQLVKLSPDDIAARFDESYAADTATPEPDARPRNPIQLLGDVAVPRLRMSRLLPLVSFAVVVLLVIGFFWSYESRTPTTESVEQVAPVVQQVPVQAAAPTETPEEAPTEISAATLPAPSGPAVLPMPVGAAVLASSVVASVGSDSDNLRIVLTQDSWLSVRDAAGRTLISAVRKQGEILSLSGSAPFAVNVGNAAGVSMSINGKIVDLVPHTKGAVATLSVAR